MKENTKNIMKKLALVAIVSVLLLSMLLTTSLAKYMMVYKSPESSSSGLDVAQWSISISEGATALTGSNITLNTTIDGVEEQKITNGRIAPGTKGMLADICITNNSEVDATYELVLELVPAQGKSIPANLIVMGGSRAGNEFTYTGDLDRGTHKSARRTLSWNWPLGSVSDSTADNTANNADFSVRIKRFNVTQKQPGTTFNFPKADEKPVYNVIYWADDTFAGGMCDIVEAFGAADGIEINTLFSREYDNTEKTQSTSSTDDPDGNKSVPLISTLTANLYESGTIDGDVMTISATQFNNKKVIPQLSETDFFVILSGRDYSLRKTAYDMYPTKVESSMKDATNTKRNQIALKFWYDLYKKENTYTNKVNPYGEVVLFVPYAFNEDAANAKIWSSITGNNSKTLTKEEHYNVIAQNAADMAAAIDNDCTSVDVGKAFLDFEGDYPDIDLYDNRSGRFASNAGAYYSACVLYSSLLGRSTVGMDVGYFGLDDETCELIQRAADAYVKSTGKELKAHAAEDEDNYSYDSWLSDPRTMPKGEAYQDEVYPEHYGALLSIVYAYKMRGALVQYEGRDFDRTAGERVFRDLGLNAAPENATPDSYLYSDGVALITASFYNCFGQDLFSNAVREKTMLDWVFGKENWENRQIHSKYVAFSKEGLTSTDVTTFKNALQPGDVFIAYDTILGNERSAIYLGNGIVARCGTTNEFGARLNYYLAVGKTPWKYSGAVEFVSIDEYTSSSEASYFFKNDTTTSYNAAIIRPFEIAKDENYSPTQNTINRMTNMNDILSYKTCSAKEGTVVNNGDTVRFTFYLKNYGYSTRTVAIKDELPSGKFTSLTVVGGDGSFSSNTFTANVTLAPGEEKTVEYTAKVSSAKGTTITMNGCTIGEVKANNITINVGVTLNSAQQTQLLSLLSDGKSATDMYAEIKTAYANASVLEYTLPDNISAAMATVFTQSTRACHLTDKTFWYANGNNYSGVTNNTMSAILAGNLYGGKYFSTPYKSEDASSTSKEGSYKITPITGVNTSNFNVGDILLFKNYDDLFDKTTDRVDSILTADQSEHAYIYIGDGKLAGVVDEKIKHLSAADSSKLVDSLASKGTWCVLRPSMK